jgi:hypothetical protein
MILIDFAGWTTNRRATATDTIVRSCGPDGRVLQTLTRTATFDYRSGAASDYRNPLNPPSSPGKSKITIAVGRQSELAAHLVGSRKTAASLSLLAGHDHEYQAHPKKGATGPVSSTGVAEIVVGTGGRSVKSEDVAERQPTSRLRQRHIRLAAHHAALDFGRPAVRAGRGQLHRQPHHYLQAVAAIPTGGLVA